MKDHCIRFFVCVAVLGLGSFVTAVDSQQRIAHAAETFMRKVSPGISAAELASLRVQGQAAGRTGPRWKVILGQISISVDDVSGEVISYSSGSLYGRAMSGPESIHASQRGRPFYSSEADLISSASKWLNRVGWAHGPDASHRPLPKMDARGQIQRSVVYVKFCDRPNGYPAQGVGNLAMIGLDSLSGEIVEMQRFIGYHYGPALLNISREQALRIARREIELPSRPLVFGPSYQDLSPREELSPRAAKLSGTRTLALGYLVVGVHDTVTIAADNGEVLSRRHGGSAGIVDTWR